MNLEENKQAAEIKMDRDNMEDLGNDTVLKKDLQVHINNQLTVLEYVDEKNNGEEQGSPHEKRNEENSKPREDHQGDKERKRNVKYDESIQLSDSFETLLRPPQNLTR